MSEPDQNYGLRPKRTTKGKYREMVGISSPKKTDRVFVQEQEEIVPAASNSSKGKSRRILVLPIVVKDGGDNVSNNEIEIEIMDGVSVSELTEVELEISAATGDEQESESEPKTKQTSNPSQHIDEILEKNDKLLESISEGPQFKKRRSKGAAGITETVFTAQTIQEMINRPLTNEEEVQIQELLIKGNLEAIVEMVFGPEAENRTRKCYDCQELVEGSDDVYAAHYDECHQCEPAFACEICDQVSNNVSEYHSHMKEHFKQPKPGRGRKKTTGNKESSEEACDSQDGSGGSNGFVCDICGKKLKHQKSLYSHRRTHTDAKAVCHICGTTLKSARYLHHHLLLHKDVDKPHKCDKCEKAFFSSSALKVHHYYNHEDHPGKFCCNICGKTFKAKQGLQFHMDSHSNELRYECSFCQKRFRGAKTRRVHEMRHREANEPNKYSCDICHKTFKTRQTLKNHEDVHASFNRYQCSLCEKRFKLRKSCLAHIRVHHNEERTEQQANADEGETAVESLLADGEEYIVTLEEGTEVEVVMEDDQVHHQLVPEADVECEIDNMS